MEKINTESDYQDKNMEIVFRYPDQLIDEKTEPQARKRIGYKPDGFKPCTEPGIALRKQLAAVSRKTVKGGLQKINNCPFTGP